MSAPAPRKCANAACNCVPPEKAKYCSAHCEGMAQKVEIMCSCGHPSCVVSSSS